MTTRTPLSGAAFALPALDRVCPARVEILGRAPRSTPPARARAALSFAVSACATARDVVRIELHVRIALRMDVAHGAVELRRHLQQLERRGGLEVARRARLDARLPDSWISTGSQPISSSAPVATTRSALRARATRLGLASTRCTSCSAVVAT